MSAVMVSINGHTIQVPTNHELYQPLVRLVHETYGDRSLLGCLVGKEG